MSDIEAVVATPEVRAQFSPDDITAAFEDFRTNGPTLVDQESGKRVGVFEVSPGRILFVSQLDGVVEITTVEDFSLSKPYPPPPRSGNALGYMILWCIPAGLALLIFILWLLG